MGGTSCNRFVSDFIPDLNPILPIIGTIGLLLIVLEGSLAGMYDLNQYPTDHSFGEFLAYCTGTGGSILIIGSAAGVAAMGMEKVSFYWFLKKISLFALLGYFGGVDMYLLQDQLFKR